MEKQMQQSGFGIVSMILGVIGLLTSCLFIGIIPAILALIFSIIGLKEKNKSHTMSIIGLLTSIVGIVIFWIFLLIVIFYSNTENNSEQENSKPYTEIQEQTEYGEEEYNEEQIKEFSHKLLAGVILFGIIFGGIGLLIGISNHNENKKENLKIKASKKKQCPICGGTRYHVFIKEEVIDEGKIKRKTTLNLNPLKPFTIYNHKEKVVRKPIVKSISKFVCDDCGNVFD